MSAVDQVPESYTTYLSTCVGNSEALLDCVGDALAAVRAILDEDITQNLPQFPHALTQETGGLSIADVETMILDIFTANGPKIQEAFSVGHQTNTRIFQRSAGRAKQTIDSALAAGDIQTARRLREPISSSGFSALYDVLMSAFMDALIAKYPGRFDDIAHLDNPYPCLHGLMESIARHLSDQLVALYLGHNPSAFDLPDQR